MTQTGRHEQSKVGEGIQEDPVQLTTMVGYRHSEGMR